MHTVTSSCHLYEHIGYIFRLQKDFDGRSNPVRNERANHHGLTELSGVFFVEKLSAKPTDVGVQT